MATRNDIRSVLHELAERGDARMSLALPPLEAGLLVRRNVRTLIAMAKLDGVDVTFHEERGLLGSVFMVRMIGSGRLLRRHVSRLVALEEAAS